MNDTTTPTKVENTPTPPTTRPSDLLVRAFEESGYKVDIEDGPNSDDVATLYVTVREAKARANGTMGPVTRYIANKATGLILGWQIL